MTNYCRLNTPGFASPVAKPHYRPDKLIFPEHIRFEFDFDVDREHIDGKVTHHLRCINTVTEIRFNAINLDIRRVTDAQGTMYTFENTGEEVIVDFNGERGDKLELTIEYSVTKPQAGFYFVNPDEDYPDISQQIWSQFQDEDARFVVPTMDNPAFKHTSEVISHIPKNWNSLSNGELISEKVEIEKKIVHWQFDKKHSTYLVTFAAGDLHEHIENRGDTLIRWYVEKGREEEAQNSYKNTEDIIEFFSEYTRFPYPYDSYSQWSASRFIFGGMENTTATTQTNLTLRDDRADLDSSSDGLVAHEAAHQWFGDWITAKSWAHAWLHESFATYFDALYTEYNKGTEEFHYQMRTNKLSYIKEDKSTYRRPLVTKLYEEPIDLFDRHLYPGGSWRVHMLRNHLGDDQFRDVLSHYLKKHGKDLVETVDLARAIEEVTGKNMDWFFDQWIYNAGFPKLKITYKWDNENGIAELTFKQTQKTGTKDGVETPLFRLPTEVQFYFGDSEERFRIELEAKEESLYFKLPGKPKIVRFDPDYTILCSVDFSKSQELLLNQLQEDPTIIGKILAAKKLEDKPSLKVIEALERELLDEDNFWGVRRRIAHNLASLGGDTARDKLIDALSIEHPKARRAVVNALSTFSHDENLASAITAMIKRGDESYFIEGDLLETLGKLKLEEYYDTIVTNMDRPTFNDHAIIKGIAGLVALDIDKGLDEVFRRATYGQPELGRNSAIVAIGKLGKHRSDRHGECLTHLKKYTKDPLFRARMAAISGLKELGLLKAIPILRKMMRREADGRVKKSVRLAIKSIRKVNKDNKEVKQLEEDVQKMQNENKNLRDRLEKLEELLEQTRES